MSFIISNGDAMDLPPGFGLSTSGVTPPPAKARILVVDDEPRIRIAYRELLGGADRIVEDCADARSAQRRLERLDIDVLVLDPSLPDRAELDLLDWIASHRIPTSVLVFSASDDIDTAITSLRRGACEFIRKHADPEQLLDAVDTVLRQRRRQREQALMGARLEQSERLHRFLVEESPDIIYTLDHRGHFIYLNQRVETLLGYRRDELLGKHYGEIVCEEDRETARYAFAERRIGERATFNHEIRLHCRSQRVRRFENRPIVAILSSRGIYRSESDAATQRFLGTAGVLRDITLRKQHEDEIAFQAFHDALTGLPNRALFMDRLELALNQARRGQHRVGLMYLDLDRFKLVNDTWGHARGDELLKGFASRVRACLRAGDTLARLGGDEFTVLLPDLAQADAALTIADKIHAELKLPFTIGGEDFRTDASIGIALYPDHGDQAETLLEFADQAMYQAKARNRIGYRPADRTAQPGQADGAGFERELLAALAAGQFELHYQPQFSIERGRIVGVEALLRWHHPERGMLAADSFLPAAVDGTAILAIGDWVLDRACADLVAWQQHRAVEVDLTINISPPEFARHNLVDRLLRPIVAHGLAPARIAVDISETMLLDDAEAVIARVAELRQQGLRVALDDFGTRYSSLNYLRRLAISGISIDQSFVHELDAASSPSPVITAIIGIARGFGLKVLAKGVETAAQATTLRALGCDAMQGFRFGRPLPAADLGELLAGGRPAATA